MVRKTKHTGSKSGLRDEDTQRDGAGRSPQGLQTDLPKYSLSAEHALAQGKRAPCQGAGGGHRAGREESLHSSYRAPDRAKSISATRSSLFVKTEKSHNHVRPLASTIKRVIFFRATI